MIMKKLSILLLALLAVLVSCKKTPEVNLEYVDVERDLITVGTTTATIQCDYEYIATLKKAYLYYGEGEDAAEMASIEMRVVQKTLYVELSGLKENTTYSYYYEFANGFNSMRSATKTFKTEAGGSGGGDEPPTPSEITLPTVVTSEVTEITTNSALCGGEITNDGGAEVTERGICWSTNANPSLNDNHIASGTGTGAFTTMMDSLAASTTYHVRAYATNEKGTAYGLDREFTTLSSGGGSGDAPTGAINGLFTINNSGDQVYFSQGNLQYTKTTQTWSFMAHQYDIVEVDGQNVGVDYANQDIISLFGWGTSGYNHGAIAYQPWSTSNNYGDYYAYGNWDYNLFDQTGMADWGYNAIVNGGNVENNGWRTLTRTEWNYVLNIRNTKTGMRYAKAKVNGVSGLILLPYNWDASNYALNDVNGGNYNSNSIGVEEWTAILETNGAVFLPAAGLRNGSGFSFVESYGNYWTSSGMTGCNGAFGLYFGSDDIGVSGYDGTSGRSVRLVRDVISHPSNTTPTVITSDVSDITSNSVVCGGEVTNDGGAEVTERGVCWSVNANPTLNDSHIATGTGIGAFTAEISDLEANTTYHVRAYATNEKGTAYGLDKEFKTLSGGGGGSIDGYFTIESLEDDNTITLYIPGDIDSQCLASVSYSTDGTTWTTLNIDATDQTISVTLNRGETVRYKGQGLQYAKNWEVEKHSCFNTSGNITVSGNIMSLLYGDGFANTTVFPSGSSHSFEGLFQGNDKLMSAINLVLPATSLVDVCYRSMFRECTSLTEAPVLPATVLSRRCYDQMFEECTSLMKAPVLPATVLSEECYDAMFFRCASLTEAPTLPATTLAAGCYRHMFFGCTSLTEAPVLPATVLSYQCYEEMFRECTSLTQTPVLPATVLADWCYRCMFSECTSLRKASKLPATTMEYNCYAGMFNMCSSLKEAPSLPAVILAESCYWNMFLGCASLTSAPNLPATTLTYGCYQGMFDGCMSLTAAPTLPAVILAEKCYYYMFEGCTSLGEVTCLATNISAVDCTTNWLKGVSSEGTFYKNAAMNDWPLNSESGIPSGWNVVDY